jgi:hypothetical protein
MLYAACQLGPLSLMATIGHARSINYCTDDMSTRLPVELPAAWTPPLRPAAVVVQASRSCTATC